MRELTHTAGWGLHVAHLQERIEGSIALICDPSVDPAAAQFQRGRLAGLREAQGLPERILAEAKPTMTPERQALLDKLRRGKG